MADADPEVSPLLHDASAGKVSLLIGTVSNSPFEVQVSENALIEDVKKQIHVIRGIPPDEQRLLLNQEELSDGSCWIGNLGIGKGTVLHLVLKLPAPLEPDLVALMEKHGLTEADQQALRKEGVVDIATFVTLPDDEIMLSGIDVVARRQTKLLEDREAAVISHVEELRSQVQRLLDDAGMSSAGRDAVRPIATLDTLKDLSIQHMADRFQLGIMDRKKLEKFAQSQRVQQMQPVPMRIVMTELQRQAQRQNEVDRMRAQVRKRRHEVWQRNAAKMANSASVSEGIPIPLAAQTLCDLCTRHGLTQADMQQLQDEGLDSIDGFLMMTDHDFQASGIDIVARREAKRVNDQLAAQKHHMLDLKKQAQALLDEAGLTGPGREALRQVASLEQLKRLRSEQLARMGLGIVDRQMVLAFCATSRVRELTPVPIATILTELEWDVKRAQEEESQRILEDQKQREMERLVAEETERRIAAQLEADRAQRIHEENARQALAMELAALPQLSDIEYARMYTLFCCCVRNKPRLRWRRELNGKPNGDLTQPERDFLDNENQRRAAAIKKHGCQIRTSNINAFLGVATLFAAIVVMSFVEDPMGADALVCGMGFAAVGFLLCGALFAMFDPPDDDPGGPMMLLVFLDTMAFVFFMAFLMALNVEYM
eukprot:COSAG06_NODE_573_length_14086_cov_30.835633_7_plen_656_part_00